MSDHDQCIEICNSLLRGELSAVETYEQAIEKFSGDSQASPLGKIKAEHLESATVLRSHVQSMGGSPSESSGAWGTFATAVEGTAKILGDSAALAALEQGEEHGISEYRDALEDEDVMEDIKTQIRSKLLPALESHLAILKGLRKA